MSTSSLDRISNPPTDRSLRRHAAASALLVFSLCAASWSGSASADNRFPSINAVAEGQGTYENRGNGDRWSIDRATVHLRASGEVDIRLEGRKLDLRVEARMRPWKGNKHVEFDITRFDGQPSNAFGWVNLDERGGFERIEMSGKEPVRLSLDFFTKKVTQLPPPVPAPGPVPPPNPLPFSEDWGFDRPGYDLREFRTDSLAVCQSSCGADPSCAAYSYNQSSRTCYLKHTASRPQPRRDTVSGERRFATSGPWGLTQQFGADQPGGDYTSFRVDDLEQCQRSCAEDRRCRAYTFNRTAFECYLKERSGETRPRAECVTGVKHD